MFLMFLTFHRFAFEDAQESLKMAQRRLQELPRGPQEEPDTLLRATGLCFLARPWFGSALLGFPGSGGPGVLDSWALALGSWALARWAVRCPGPGSLLPGL